MELIIIGVFLFTVGHMFKRLVPAGREFLDLSLGKNLGKGFLAIFVITGVILITLGYYRNEFDIYFYSSPTWMTGLMHLMMLVSVAVMQAENHTLGTWSLRGKINILCFGVNNLGIAHLLVNGTAMAIFCLEV